MELSTDSPTETAAIMAAPRLIRSPNQPMPPSTTRMGTGVGNECDQGEPYAAKRYDHHSARRQRGEAKGEPLITHDAVDQTGQQHNESCDLGGGELLAADPFHLFDQLTLGLRRLPLVGSAV